MDRVDFNNAKPTVYYTYDALGNRLTKKVNNVTTYYIRDAQGNTLATYEQNGNNTNLTEQHLYGSARIGMRQTNLLVKNTAGIVSLNPNQRVFYRSVGHKAYEQCNHLGDVLVTLSDKVLNQGGYYQAIVKNASLTYPFGWAIPERTYTSASGEYRFGFNGKENDKETGWQDYGFRLHDQRIARFISVDPLTKQYPHYTPYQFAGNKPIKYIDLDGLEEAEPELSWTDRLLNRTTGAFQVAGGYFSASASVVLFASPEPFTKVIAFGGVVYGADQMVTGATKLWTGEDQKSFFNQGLSAGQQALGQDKATADFNAGLLETGMDVYSMGKSAVAEMQRRTSKFFEPDIAKEAEDLKRINHIETVPGSGNYDKQIGGMNCVTCTETTAKYFNGAYKNADEIPVSLPHKALNARETYGRKAGKWSASFGSYQDMENAMKSGKTLKNGDHFGVSVWNPKNEIGHIFNARVNKNKVFYTDSQIGLHNVSWSQYRQATPGLDITGYKFIRFNKKFK